MAEATLLAVLTSLVAAELYSQFRYTKAIVLWVAARLLPKAERDRWAEEWRAESRDGLTVRHTFDLLRGAAVIRRDRTGASTRTQTIEPVTVATTGHATQQAVAAIAAAPPVVTRAIIVSHAAQQAAIYHRMRFNRSNVIIPNNMEQAHRRLVSPEAALPRIGSLSSAGHT